MPHYIIDPPEYDLEITEEKIVLPERISYCAAGNIWTTPKNLDFRAFEDQILSKSSKEKALLKKLDALPGVKLNGSTTRAYKLIVKLEKILEWENLLKLKQSLLKKTINVNAQEEEEKIHTQMLSSQGPSTEMNKGGFIRTIFPTFSQEIRHEIDPYVDE